MVNTGETIARTPEIVENPVGTALLTRIQHLDQCRGIGPPDLCLITKEARPGATMKLLKGNKATKQVYYHYIIGHDIWGKENIGAYIEALLKGQEKGGLLSTMKYTIVDVLYCTYNSFRKLDIRVRTKLPSKDITVEAFDQRGRLVDVEDYYWKEIGLVTRLRAMLPHPKPALDCLKVYPQTLDIPSEKTFMGHLHEALTAVLPDERQLWDSDAPFGQMLERIQEYFAMNQRYSSVYEFFLKFSDKSPLAAVQCASILGHVRKADEAMKTLDEAKKKFSVAAPLLVAQAEVLISSGQNDRLLKIVDELLDTRENLRRRDWLVITQAYMALGQPDMALMALNCVPTALIPELMADNHPKTTQPREPYMPPYYGMQEEERDPLMLADVEHNLFHLPAARFTEELLECYTLLVGMLHKMGWDELLDLRSQVFVMEAEQAEGTSQPVGANSTAGQTADCGPRPPAASKTAAGVSSTQEAKKEPEAEKEESDEAKTESKDETQGDSTDGAQEDDNDNDKPSDDDALADDGGSDIDSDGKQEEESKEQESVEAKKEEENTDAIDDDDDGGEGEGGKKSAGPQTPTEKLQQEGRSRVDSGESPAAPPRSATSPAGVADGEQQETRRVLGDRRTSVNTYQGMRKRLCTRWLDTLFHALYEDLKAFAAWIQEEEQTQDEVMPTERPSTLWLKRGALAERLRRLAHAEKAYRLCVEEGNPLGWAKVLTMYANAGYVKECLLAASRYCGTYVKNKNAEETTLLGDGDEYPNTDQLMNPLVHQCIFKIIALKGLAAVRVEAEKLGDLHQYVNEAFFQSVGLHTNGYDR